MRGQISYTFAGPISRLLKYLAVSGLVDEVQVYGSGRKAPCRSQRVPLDIAIPVPLQSQFHPFRSMLSLCGPLCTVAIFPLRSVAL